MAVFGIASPKEMKDRLFAAARGKRPSPDEPKLWIAPQAAHFLLFALDSYVSTDQDGCVTEPRNGLSREGWQQLRDDLFAIHQHPKGVGHKCP